MLDRANAAIYWERESRHDTVISLTYGRPALDAFCRVIELWIEHFLSVKVQIKPVRKIDEPRWAWHIGLDAESTAILNELWAGSEIEQGRMRNILAIFALQFDEPAAMRADIAGRTVYLALACEDGVVRMKPQNLLTNLPLAVKPEYWDQAKRALARRDPVMGAIMRRHPRVYMTVRGEPFMTLARAIVGQQISVKAAQSVWNRVCICLEQKITPGGGRGRRPKEPARLRPVGPQDRVHRRPRAALRRRQDPRAQLAADVATRRSSPSSPTCAASAAGRRRCS